MNGYRIPGAALGAGACAIEQRRCRPCSHKACGHQMERGNTVPSIFINLRFIMSWQRHVSNQINLY